MPRSANRCPRCGSVVSRFAAGCAVCGADLEAHRLRTRRERVGATALPSWRGELRERSLLTILLVVVALFAPLYGMVLSAVVAWDRSRHGQQTMRNLALACLALALIVFLTPVLGLPRLPPFS
jgi:uncharacterized membrane protein YidH (DUF202 family)